MSRPVDFRTQLTPVESSPLGFHFFRLVISLMLAVAIIKVMSNGSVPTLGGLLQEMTNAPTISTDWITWSQTNFGDTFPWGFQWLGTIIDFFSSFTSSLMFAGTAIFNMVSFVFWILRYLLIA